MKIQTLWEEGHPWIKFHKSWRSPSMVWGTLCNACNKLSWCKMRKGQEDPEEPPQGKTSTWSCSAYTIKENQVSSWQMKWEQAWTWTSRPVVCAEVLHGRVAAKKPLLTLQNKVKTLKFAKHRFNYKLNGIFIKKILV